MVRGVYSVSNTSKRRFSVKEIAAICCTSSPKVQTWIESDLLKSVPKDQGLVEESELISFLLTNGLPVPPALLPPKTKKILFVANETKTFSQKSSLISHLCHELAKTGLVLAEVSVTGRNADLKILTFVPDAVIYFLETYNRSTVNTLSLLESMPELKTVLVVDEETEQKLKLKPVDFPVHLIVNDAQPMEKVIECFRTLFDH